MSLDFLINYCTDDPHGDPDSDIEVSTFIDAFNDFELFRVGRMTWQNDKWRSVPGFNAVSVSFVNHAPARFDGGGFDYDAGTAEACEVTIGAAGTDHWERICEWLAHLANALKANLWDLQSDERVDL